MKKIAILFSLLTVLFVSCTNYQPVPVVATTTTGYSGDYQMMTSPTGAQMVVVNDGGRSFLMDYLLFNSLMSRGGYSNVINHYHTYPSSGRYYNASAYRGWRQSRYNYSGSGLRSSGVSTGSNFRRVTPSTPSRSIFSRPSSPSCRTPL